MGILDGSAGNDIYKTESTIGHWFHANTRRNMDGMDAGRALDFRHFGGNDETENSVDCAVVADGNIDVADRLEYQLRCLMEYGNEQLVMQPLAMPQQLTNVVSSNRPPGIF